MDDINESTRSSVMFSQEVNDNWIRYYYFNLIIKSIIKPYLHFPEAKKFDQIRFAAYRTASKLRYIQKRTLRESILSPRWTLCNPIFFFCYILIQMHPKFWTNLNAPS